MRAVAVGAHAVSALCVALLLGLVVFDAQAERFTAGLVPEQFSRTLEVELLEDYTQVLGVAHNAGDDTAAALEALAHGVDAVEIDVTSVGGELHASHDAPVPVLDTLFFRGPELAEAWEVAQLRETIVLHLKERSRDYLHDVLRFVETQPQRNVIFQSGDLPSLRFLRDAMPSAEALLLIFDDDDLERLHRRPDLLDQVDGVSVRDRLLTEPEHRWLKARGVKTFAWTVNEGPRLNELVEQDVDGIITDRLDIMSLLGGRVAAGR